MSVGLVYGFVGLEWGIKWVFVRAVGIAYDSLGYSMVL